MKKPYFLSLALLWILHTPLWAQDSTQKHPQLAAKQLSQMLSGMTMVGKYADGMNFKETYHPDGSITYADDETQDKGRWFIRDNLFCTFYEVSNGACFSVRTSGANCYEYFIAEDEAGTVSGDAGAWNSIGWDEAKPSTCDLTPQTS